MGSGGLDGVGVAEGSFSLLVTDIRMPEPIMVGSREEMMEWRYK